MGGVLIVGAAAGGDPARRCTGEQHSNREHAARACRQTQGQTMIVVVMERDRSGKAVVGRRSRSRSAGRSSTATTSPRRRTRREHGLQHAARRRRPLAVARPHWPTRRRDPRARRQRRARVLGAEQGLSRPPCRMPKAPGDVRFVDLKADLDTIAVRLAARKHRYMPASLLASQFATLEDRRTRSSST